MFRLSTIVNPLSSRYPHLNWTAIRTGYDIRPWKRCLFHCCLPLNPCLDHGYSFVNQLHSYLGNCIRNCLNCSVKAGNILASNWAPQQRSASGHLHWDSAHCLRTYVQKMADGKQAACWYPMDRTILQTIGLVWINDGVRLMPDPWGSVLHHEPLYFHFGEATQTF